MRAPRPLRSHPSEPWPEIPRADADPRAVDGGTASSWAGSVEARRARHFATFRIAPPKFSSVAGRTARAAPSHDRTTGGGIGTCSGTPFACIGLAACKSASVMSSTL
eukprot:15660-Prymnesium_polylepis.1